MAGHISGMRAYRVSLLPLAISGIIIATAIPLELGGDSGWNWSLQGSDIIQNLLLYLPLGIALSRSRLTRVALIAALLSLAIEISQLWQAGRFASLVDVASNTVGAVVAAWCCQRLSESRRNRCVTPRVTIIRFLLPLWTVVVAFYNWREPVKPVDLSGWDRGYSLQLGNETGGGRAWRGTVAEVRVQSSSAAVDVAGPVSLTGGAAVVLDPSETRRLIDQATATGRFIARATVTTSDVDQTGPARIISLSEDTLNRNFDLGQEGRSLVLRVRTQASGPNGQAGRVISTPILQAGVPHRVEASFDGRVSRIRVDGYLVGRSDLGARGCRTALFCGWAVPLEWGVAGGTAALLLLLLIPVSSTVGILALCSGGALAMIAIISRLAAWPMLLGTWGWMPVVALFGGLTVALARILAIRQESRPAS